MVEEDLVPAAVCLYVAVWRRASVAVHTLVHLARGGAWPERLRPCHWRLAVPGFPGVVLIPLGRLPTSPIPLLARVALWFHHPHLRAGHIHARRLSESIEAVAIARQAYGYAQRCGNNSSGIQERCRGSGGGLRFIAYSHGKSSWGTHRAALGGTLTARELAFRECGSSWGAKPIVPPPAAPSRPVNFGSGDLVLIAVFLHSGVW